MTGEKILHIVWEGPVSATDVANLLDASRDRGIYAIYGPHNVYGQSTLLYIGKTERPFGVRIREHGWHENERSAEIEIYVGRFAVPEGQEAPDIELVERLLIYAHGPAYNAYGVADPPQESPLRTLRILNWGSYRSMLPEVSGLRWLTPHQQIRSMVVSQGVA